MTARVQEAEKKGAIGVVLAFEAYGNGYGFMAYALNYNFEHRWKAHIPAIEVRQSTNTDLVDLIEDKDNNVTCIMVDGK